jgi:RHS repeat-associated protein
VFGYDALGRLAWAQPETGAPEIRVSDVQGNRYRRRDRADRRYGANGELSAASTKAGTETYRYDADGQLVEKSDAAGEWRYHWNAGGELVAVERPDKERVEFEYDALGRRVSKRAAGAARRWLWDGDQPLHEWVEGQEGGAVTWLFDPGEYNLSAKIVDGRCSTVIGDQLGAPQLLLGPEGEREWSASLSIHGELRELEGERGVLPFRWPGQYEDEETGLYYNRFRYYDPGTGCFLSPDPLRVVGGLALGPYVRRGRFAPGNGLAELGPTTSLYAYVDDPLSWIDPYGLVEIHREGAYKVHAYAGPAAGGREHAPLHVHVYEGNERGQGTRVLMEDWVDGGRLKGRRGEVYPGDGSLPRRARRMIRNNLDDLSANARRVFDTGSC